MTKYRFKIVGSINTDKDKKEIYAQIMEFLHDLGFGIVAMTADKE